MNAQLDQLSRWIENWPLLLPNLFLFIGLPLDNARMAWSIVQIACLMLAFSLAFVGSRIVTPMAEQQVRSMQLGPKRLRAAAVVLRRTFGILLALNLWMIVLVMRATTWDSRSYFLHLCATLVTAWVVISISSRIIRNRALARLVEAGGWILVTLTLLGILPEAMNLLDSAAIQMNDFRVSLLTILQGLIILSILTWLALLVSALVERQLSANEDFTPTMRVLISKAAHFGLISIAVITGLYAIGIDFTALTFVSGALGVGLGFGLQKVVSNLVSGIILLLDKSIKPGDVISVGEGFGWITALNARYASVSMRDGREILIPNEDLITQQVQNWSFNDPYVRIDITFGVSYDCDPHEVRTIAVEAAKSHPRVAKNAPQYPVVCHVTGFGDSSIDFVLRFFIADPANGITNIRGDVFLALWDAFKANDIAIPYPHRELILHKSTADILSPRDGGVGAQKPVATKAGTKRSGRRAKSAQTADQNLNDQQ